MKENYFLINGTIYIVKYVDFKPDVYKLVDNQRVKLNQEEKEHIEKVLKKNSSYIYTSMKLNEVLENNESITNNELAPNLLEWLEGIIPVDSRDNFYRNVETLKIQEVEELDSNDILGEYNAKENTISMLSRDKYVSDEEYAKTLLHELIHMSSSKYEKETMKTISGLDESVLDFNKRNRGLTEGITEVIAFNGVRGIDKKASIYCMEGLLADQLSRLINPNIIMDAYFNNKGTDDLTRELRRIGYASDKAYGLFRDIELNFLFSRESEKENVLGNIQSSLLDYFEKKLKVGIMNDTIPLEQVPALFDDYGKALITPPKLKAMGYDPEKFEGVAESVKKYLDLKAMYNIALSMDEEQQVNEIEETKEQNKFGLKAAGYSSVVLLSIVTAVIALGIIVLGVYLGM